MPRIERGVGPARVIDSPSSSHLRMPALANGTSLPTGFCSRTAAEKPTQRFRTIPDTTDQSLYFESSGTVTNHIQKITQILLAY